MHNTIIKEFENRPDVFTAVYNEGGRNGETREWLERFWNNFFLRGSVIFDETGDNSQDYYNQQNTGLPFGRGYIIDQNGNVALPYFGHNPQMVIDKIYSLIDTTGGGCEYVIGDINCEGLFNGLDITFGVSYFKGGPVPSYECECTPGNSWYVSGDVNASCSYNGMDITYCVAYFKGGPDPVPCPDCPPVNY